MLKITVMVSLMVAGIIAGIGTGYAAEGSIPVETVDGTSIMLNPNGTWEYVESPNDWTGLVRFVGYRMTYYAEHPSQRDPSYSIPSHTTIRLVLKNVSGRAITELLFQLRVYPDNVSDSSQFKALYSSLWTEAIKTLAPGEQFEAPFHYEATAGVFGETPDAYPLPLTLGVCLISFSPEGGGEPEVWSRSNWAAWYVIGLPLLPEAETQSSPL